MHLSERVAESESAIIWVNVNAVASRWESLHQNNSKRLSALIRVKANYSDIKKRTPEIRSTGC